ncbi:hypothetical protein CL614_07360 [archaeon]|nr:hypothetical protein [archaeon]
MKTRTKESHSTIVGGLSGGMLGVLLFAACPPAAIAVGIGFGALCKGLHRRNIKKLMDQRNAGDVSDIVQEWKRTKADGDHSISVTRTERFNTLTHLFPLERTWEVSDD